MERRAVPIVCLLGMLAVLGFSLQRPVVPAQGDQEDRAHLPLILLQDSRIAFVSDRDGNAEIYTIWSSGWGLRRLTSNTAADTGPRWSPERTRIAFVSERDGNQEVYVMRADGSEQRNLTSHPSGDHSPNWSPDGTQIVFVSRRDGNDEIYVVDVGTSALANLTRHASHDTSPDWASDGTRIAFVSGRDENRQVHVMDADGGGQTSITDGPTEGLSPVWAPDGARIAYVHLDGTSQIHTVSWNGSDDTDVSCFGSGAGTIVGWKDATEPAWSPDGHRMAIALVGIHPGLHSPTMVSRGISLPDPHQSGPYKGEGCWGDTSLVRQVEDGSHAPTFAYSDPVWSPGGLWIAYMGSIDGNEDVYVVRSDGQTLRNLTNHPARDHSPSW